MEFIPSPYVLSKTKIWHNELDKRVLLHLCISRGLIISEHFNVE